MKMNLQRIKFTILLFAWLSVMPTVASTLPYKDAKLPVEERVADLLSRMTVEEKVGQLVCLMGWNSYELSDGRVSVSDAFRKQVKEQNVGMYWAVMRADPWTQKTLSNGLNPSLAAQAANAMQHYAVDSTRLGIPLLLAEEAPHGHMAIGATVFPTGLGMAATWSPELMKKVGQVIGKEIRLQGGHISYGPVLDLGRDPRWSRVEETMGEDPYLSGALGADMVQGLGAGRLTQPYSTVAALKHFIGYGSSEGGLNGARSVVGERELRQLLMPQFKRVIDAGARSVMTAYNTIDGIPCTSNRALISGVLRGEWEFDKGLVVSDLYSIDVIHNTHHVAESKLGAAIAALNAGVDVDLGGNCYCQLPEALKKGLVTIEQIDKAVSRVLRLKFELGLFENPYVKESIASFEVHDKEAISVARQVALSSITLLKNNGILPLRKDIRVAVVGPNAHNAYNLLGDYTAPQPDGKVITIYDGIKNILPAGNCTYVKGCAVRDTSFCDIDAAVDAANASDVIVAVVGGSSARDFRTSYEDTGAATVQQHKVSDMECGEGFDRATLTLLGRQNELLSALKQTGKPIIVVYIEGRPLDKNWADENADALLTAYYPGEQGGSAIADVLFGDYNPSGRLPLSVPRHEGQIPVCYNRPASLHDYVDMPATPLYSFGFGLSYTTFDYSDLNITGDGKGGYDVSFILTNTGSRRGDEVVQLYVRDRVASVVQPDRQLKAFDRITLDAGQSCSVTLHLDRDALAIVDSDMRWTVEPGTFDVLVGASSTDIRLTGYITIE